MFQTVPSWIFLEFHLALSSFFLFGSRISVLSILHAMAFPFTDDTFMYHKKGRKLKRRKVSRASQSITGKSDDKPWLWKHVIIK